MAFNIIITLSYLCLIGLSSRIETEATNTSNLRKLILPPFNYFVIHIGTKWCGMGDIARNYDDLGYFTSTDRCCRQHDHCNDTIPAGVLSNPSKHGLTNDGLIITLNCKCDIDFYHCLTKTSCASAQNIGSQYFNIFQRKCFFHFHPSVCILKETSPLFLNFQKRCTNHIYDADSDKIWQWFNTPFWNLKLNSIISGVTC